MNRFTITSITILALLVAAAGSARAAEPPVARHTVHAVADGEHLRILVRWNQLEGATRYSYFDVLRRSASATDFTQVNADPIGPMTTAAEIEALFNAPENARVLADVVASFGPAYASALLALRTPAAGSDQTMQAKLLPDFNFGAAIALGLGFMDANVVAGETYVYEVWGLDAQGFRTERLGRATATAGTPASLLAVESLRCVEPNDDTGHLATFLRWNEPAAETGYRAGYDILRVRRNPDGTCPPVGPGLPGVVRANGKPTLAESPGRVREGRQLFEAKCASCHASRDAAPVAGSTIADFTRRLYPEIWPAPADAAHDVPSLKPVDFDEIEAIYDYINEFHFRDEGQDTPAQLPEAGDAFCYVPYPRDLIGAYGTSAAPVQCTFTDRVAPEPPTGVRTARSDRGTYEACEISWDPNAEDTVEYRLFRMNDVPRRAFEADGATLVATLPQSAGGARLSHVDLSLGENDATQSFFYAARAYDESGNASAWSSWAPCVPRDVVAPRNPTLDIVCASDPKTGRECRDCDDRRGDQRWIDAGGDPNFFALDGNDCQAGATPSAEGDPFLYRPFRSFDGLDYQPGPEQAGSFDASFSPLSDTPLHMKIVALDKSGNSSEESSPFLFHLFGKPLPAPRINTVSDLGGGRIKIRFVGPKPSIVLGYVLYRHYEGDGGEPEGDPDFVVRFASENLGDLYQPSKWAVKTGAKRISERQGTYYRTSDPPGQDEFLYWDYLESEWVMAAQVDDVDGLILRLHAVSLAGREGYTIPYRWDGYRPGDGRLEWPTFRTENSFLQNSFADLSATWNSVSERVILEWTANPQGCADDFLRPFVVYRKSGSRGEWQQISPAFRCNAGNTAMVFSDRDVRSGQTYVYRVVRFDSTGEFQIRFGPTTIAIP